MSSIAAVNGEKGQTSIGELLLDSLFGFAFIMNRKIDAEQRSLIIFMAIDALQVLNFPINSAAQLPWEDTAVEPLALTLDVVSGDFIGRPSLFTLFVAVLVLSILWTSLFVGLSISVAWRFVADAPQSEVILKILRSVATLTTTTLFLPFTTVIARSLACPGVERTSGDGTWIGSGMECTSAGPIIMRIFLALLLIVFSFLSVFISAVYIDRNPASKSWSAKSHGQMDAAMLLVKVALVLCYSVFRDFVLDSWVLVVLLLLAGAAWLGMAVRYLPFVHPGINAMQAGFACVFLWSTLVLALARYTGTRDQSLLLYLGSVLAYCGGFLACYMREFFIAALPLEACESLVHLDVWARHRMQEYSRVVESRGSSVEQSRKGQHAVPRRRRPRYGAPLRSLKPAPADAQMPGRTGNVLAGSATGAIGAVTKAMQQPPAWLGNMLTSARAGRGRGSVVAPTRGQGGLYDAEDEGLLVDSRQGQDRARRRMQMMHELDGTFFGWRLANMKYATRRHREDEHRLYTAERAYRQMAAHFGQTAMAHVLAAEFYHQFCFENNFAEAQALAQGRLRSPSLDLQYFIYGRTRGLREGADSSKLSALDRVIFESLSRQAQESKVAAMRSILKLWEHLADDRPDVATVVGIGVEIETGLKKTDELYRTMMRLNQGALVARGYAEFLVEMMNDPLTAVELFNKADRLEERHTRQRARAVRHVVFGSEAPTVDQLDDSTANITVSASDGSVGEILSASPSTCRMLGYNNTQQLIGLKFQTLLPDPIRGIYSRRLHQLQRCGFSDALNQTEVSFALPSSGAVLPVIISLLESTPDEATSAPRLSVGIDVLQCEEDVIFFGGKRRGYKVLSASARSMQLLGTDSEQLQREPIQMAQCFPTMDGTMYDPGLQAVSVMLAILRGDSPSQPTSGRSEDAAIIAELEEIALKIERHLAGESGEPSELARKTTRSKGNPSLAAMRGLTTSTRRLLLDSSRSTSGSKQTLPPIDGGNEQQLHKAHSNLQTRAPRPGYSGAVRTTETIEVPDLPPELRLAPVLQLGETALIPVETAQGTSAVVLGSVQDLALDVGQEAYMLRWRAPSQGEAQAMRQAVRKSLVQQGYGLEARHRHRSRSTSKDSGEADAEDQPTEGSGGKAADGASASTKTPVIRIKSVKGSKRSSFLTRMQPDVEEVDGVGIAEMGGAGGTGAGDGRPSDLTAVASSTPGAEDEAKSFSSSNPGSGSGEQPVRGLSAHAANAVIGNVAQSVTSGATADPTTSATALRKHPSVGSSGPGIQVIKGLQGLEGDSLGEAKSGSGSDSPSARRPSQSPIDPFSRADGGHPMLAGGSHGSGTLTKRRQSHGGPRAQGTNFRDGASGMYAPGAGSVQSNRSWLTGQLAKILHTRSATTDAEVNVVRWTFRSTVVAILAMGIAFIFVQRSIGESLQEVSNQLYLSAEQGLQFQIYDGLYRSIASQQGGISPALTVDEEYAQLKPVAVEHERIVKILQDSTPQLNARRGFDDAKVARWTVTEPAVGVSRAESYNQSLLQMSSFLSSTMLLAAAPEVPALSFGDRGYSTLNTNSETYLQAVNESLSLRQVDVSTSFQRGQLIVGVVGLGCFILALAVSAVLFARAIASLRSRSARIVELMFFMPQQVAKALRKHASSRLARTMNQLEEDGGRDEEDERRKLMEEDLETTIAQTLNNDDKAGGGISQSGGAAGAAQFATGNHTPDSSAVLIASGSDGTGGTQTAQDGKIVSRMSFAAPTNAAETEEKLKRDQAKWKAMVSQERKEQPAQEGGPEGDSLVAGGSMEASSGLEGSLQAIEGGPHDVLALQPVDGATGKALLSPARLVGVQGQSVQRRLSGSVGGRSRHGRNRRRAVLKQRPFNDTWDFTWRSTGGFLVPVALSFIWVIFLVLSIALLLRAVQQSNERLVTTERLAMDSVRLVRKSIDFIFLQSNVSRNALRAEIEDLEGRLLETSSRVVVGGRFTDESTGLETNMQPIDDEVGKAIMLEDACFGSTVYDECREISDGVLRTGARNALIAMIRVERAVLDAQPQPDLVIGTVPQLSAFLRNLVLMSDVIQPHLRDSFARVAEAYSVDSADRIRRNLRINDAVLGTSLAVIAVVVALSYWNAADKLAQPLSAAWQVIMVLPPGVLNALPEMKRGVRKELTRMQLGVAGGPAGAAIAKDL